MLKKTAPRIRGRHDDSMDSPMVRSTQAKTSDDCLDTPLSAKVASSAVDASHGDSPMLMSVQKRRNRLISSDSDEEESSSPPRPNERSSISYEKSSSIHDNDNEESITDDN